MFIKHRLLTLRNGKVQIIQRRRQISTSPWMGICACALRAEVPNITRFEILRIPRQQLSWL